MNFFKHLSVEELRAFQDVIDGIRFKMIKRKIKNTFAYLDLFNLSFAIGEHIKGRFLK